MHYSRTLVLIFAGLGLASPSPSPALLLRPDANVDPSLKLTDHTANIDLANFEERVDGSLEKRRKADICKASFARDAGCVTITGVTAQVALGIASLLKSDSNAHDCSAHTASVDGVAWRVYATGTNCDTTAQLNTIQGAFTKYLEKQEKKVCGVHCLRVSHGGTYAGYVTLAPAGTRLDSFYCGSAYSFGNCVSGGKNDT